MHHHIIGKFMHKILPVFELFVNFLIWQQKVTINIVFDLVFKKDSKMGSAIFVHFVQLSPVGL
jgi:hypothetical protein